MTMWTGLLTAQGMALLLALFGAGLLAWPALRAQWVRVRVRAVLLRHASEVLEDIALPSSRGGLLAVDQLARGEGLLLVVQTRFLGGRIVGMEENRWSCGGGWQFANPVQEMRGPIRALRSLAGQQYLVHHLVVFTGRVRFDEEPPPGVTDLHGLDATIHQLLESRVTDQDGEAGWQLIRKLAQPAGSAQRDQRRREELRQGRHWLRIAGWGALSIGLLAFTAIQLSSLLGPAASQ